MSAKKGSRLGLNPFKRAMRASIEIAGTISAFLRATLEAKKGDDERIEDLHDYFVPYDDALQEEVLRQSGDLLERRAHTKQTNITIKGLQPHLRKWMRLTENVYEVDSEEFMRLFIGGTKDFYKGPRFSKLGRLKTLILGIGNDLALAAVKAMVQERVDVFTGNSNTQTDKVMNVKTNSANVKKIVEESSEAIWYVYLGLLMIFIKNSKLALAFLPMELIYKAAKQKIYTKVVKAKTKMKLCNHRFKRGEKVTITNNKKVDLWVGLARDAKTNDIVWYLIKGGDTANIDAELLGDLRYKYVMCLNKSGKVSGNITFVIHHL